MQEDDHADDVVAAHDEIAERLDDVAGVTVEQNQAGGSDIERQPVERDEQQQGGEPGKFCRCAQVKNDQQRQQRQRDAHRSAAGPAGTAETGRISSRIVPKSAKTSHKSP